MFERPVSLHDRAQTFNWGRDQNILSESKLQKGILAIESLPVTMTDSMRKHVGHFRFLSVLWTGPKDFKNSVTDISFAFWCTVTLHTDTSLWCHKMSLPIWRETNEAQQCLLSFHVCLMHIGKYKKQLCNHIVGGALEIPALQGFIITFLSRYSVGLVRTNIY